MSGPLYDGSVVVVTTRVAALLGQHVDLRALRDKAFDRRDWDAHATFMGLHALHMLHVEEVASKISGSDCGTAIPAVPEPGPSSEGQVVGTAEVARMAGCSQRAVTKAASAGRLRGVFSAGAWWFKSEDVADWLASRPAA